MNKEGFEILNIEDFIKIEKDEQEINQLSPLVWAYVGDCVYELYVRTYLVDNTKLNPHKLHIEAIKFVKAGAQCKALEQIMEILTDAEKAVLVTEYGLSDTCGLSEEYLKEISSYNIINTLSLQISAIEKIRQKKARK